MSAETQQYQVDPDLVATVRDLFRERSPHDAVAKAEVEGLSERLWDEITGLGLHLVGVPEERGGSGGTLLDAVAIVQAAGEYAVAAPVAESILAGLLLADAGADVPEGLLSVAPQWAAPGDEARNVPFGRNTAHVVAVTEGGDVVLSPAEVTAEAVDTAGMPSDTMRIGGEAVGKASDQALLYGSLLRAAALAGAMDGAADITLQYTQERSQFGRPIAQFQAVAQHNVTLAQMAAMSTLSAQRAAIAAMRGPASFEILSAKLVAAKNATVAARAAHQAHGAIGMTQEYRLQQLTRRLYAWRGDYGDEKSLALRIGAAVAQHGSINDVVTGGSDVLEVR